ncbi:hypothetical protein D3C78_1804090 [compost metagenome]
MDTPNSVEVSAVSAKRRLWASNARLKRMMAEPLTIGPTCTALAGSPGIRPSSLRCWGSEW